MNQARELGKALLAARAGFGVETPRNKNPIRIQFRFRKPDGPLQDGNLEGDTVALETQTSPVYGVTINGVLHLAESSAVVWCPSLERKCIHIFADPTELLANPVLIQANIRSSDLKTADWITISDPITKMGIYPIAVPASSAATPFMFEPEITLLRILGLAQTSELGTFKGTLPKSIEAIFSGCWSGEEEWVMRAVNSYQGM